MGEVRRLRRDGAAAPLRVPAQPSTEDIDDALDGDGVPPTGGEAPDGRVADDLVAGGGVLDDPPAGGAAPDGLPADDEVFDGVARREAREAGAPDIAAAEEPAELDERGRQILAFEKRWWRQAGAKEQAVRDTFGLSATRYYQLLNALLDNPLALAHDPIVVQRLRRLRASRARHR